jgi:hypothetical protein
MSGGGGFEDVQVPRGLSRLGLTLRAWVATKSATLSRRA